ncbi:MAP kinase kinase kinase mkh1 [Smittium culicis]|uniref:MAP kinase kinase kinase mkh1 n=1 Tax=Smittium culicis TaxID=133412 RepID=A0A1R1XQV3_9FUNG|nr:MAP kinase kinase kinase mkh1 [Smittium culicis]
MSYYYSDNFNDSYNTHKLYESDTSKVHIPRDTDILNKKTSHRDYVWYQEEIDDFLIKNGFFHLVKEFDELGIKGMAFYRLDFQVLQSLKKKPTFEDSRKLLDLINTMFMNNKKQIISKLNISKSSRAAKPKRKTISGKKSMRSLTTDFIPKNIPMKLNKSSTYSNAEARLAEPFNSQNVDLSNKTFKPDFNDDPFKLNSFYKVSSPSFYHKNINYDSASAHSPRFSENSKSNLDSSLDPSSTRKNIDFRNNLFSDQELLPGKINRDNEKNLDSRVNNSEVSTPIKNGSSLSKNKYDIDSIQIPSGGNGFSFLGTPRNNKVLKSRVIASKPTINTLKDLSNNNHEFNVLPFLNSPADYQEFSKNSTSSNKIASNPESPVTNIFKKTSEKILNAFFSDKSKLMDLQKYNNNISEETVILNSDCFPDKIHSPMLISTNYYSSSQSLKNSPINNPKTSKLDYLGQPIYNGSINQDSEILNPKSKSNPPLISNINSTISPLRVTKSSHTLHSLLKKPSNLKKFTDDSLISPSSLSSALKKTHNTQSSSQNSPSVPFNLLKVFDAAPISSINKKENPTKLDTKFKSYKTEISSDISDNEWDRFNKLDFVKPLCKYSKPTSSNKSNLSLSIPSKIQKSLTDNTLAEIELKNIINSVEKDSFPKNKLPPKISRKVTTHALGITLSPKRTNANNGIDGGNANNTHIPILTHESDSKKINQIISQPSIDWSATNSQSSPSQNTTALHPPSRKRTINPKVQLKKLNLSFLNDISQPNKTQSSPNTRKNTLIDLISNKNSINYNKAVYRNETNLPKSIKPPLLIQSNNNFSHSNYSNQPNYDSSFRNSPNIYQLQQETNKTLAINYVYARVGFFVTDFTLVSIKGATSGDDISNMILNALLGIAAGPDLRPNICFVDKRENIDAVNISSSQLWEKCINSTSESLPRIVICFGEVGPFDSFLNPEYNKKKLNHPMKPTYSFINSSDSDPFSPMNPFFPIPHLSERSYSSPISYNSKNTITLKKSSLSSREQGGEFIEPSPSPKKNIDCCLSTDSDLNIGNKLSINNPADPIFPLNPLLEPNNKQTLSLRPNRTNHTPINFSNSSDNSSITDQKMEIKASSFKQRNVINTTVDKSNLPRIRTRNQSSPETKSASVLSDDKILNIKESWNLKKLNSPSNNIESTPGPFKSMRGKIPINVRKSYYKKTESRITEKSLLRESFSNSRIKETKTLDRLTIDTDSIFRRRPSGQACDSELLSSDESSSINDRDNLNEISKVYHIDNYNRPDSYASLDYNISEVPKLLRRNAIAEPGSPSYIGSRDLTSSKTTQEYPIFNETLFPSSRSKLLNRIPSKNAYSRPSTHLIAADLDKFFPDYDFDQPVFETIKLPIEIPPNQNPNDILEELKIETMDTEPNERKSKDEDFIRSAFRKSIDYIFNAYVIGDNSKNTEIGKKDSENEFSALGRMSYPSALKSQNDLNLESEIQVDNPNNDLYKRKSSIVSFFDDVMQQGRDPGDSIDSSSFFSDMRNEGSFSIKNSSASIKIVDYNRYSGQIDQLADSNQQFFRQNSILRNSVGIKVGVEVSRQRSLRAVLREKQNLQNYSSKDNSNAIQGSELTNSSSYLNSSQDFSANRKSILSPNDKSIFPSIKKNSSSNEISFIAALDEKFCNFEYESKKYCGFNRQRANFSNSQNSTKLWGVDSEELPPSKKIYPSKIPNIDLSKSNKSTTHGSSNEPSENIKFQSFEIDSSRFNSDRNNIKATGKNNQADPSSILDNPRIKISQGPRATNAISTVITHEFLLKRANSLFNKSTPQTKDEQDLVDAAVLLTKNNPALKLKFLPQANKESESNLQDNGPNKIFSNRQLSNTILENSSEPIAVLFDKFGLSQAPVKVRWLKGKLIGKGSFGHVYLALNCSDGKVFAVKQIKFPMNRLPSNKSQKKKNNLISQLYFEISLMRDLNHPNIVQYYGFEMSDTQINIFLEYVSGGTISSLIVQHGPIPEPVVHSFVNQILQSLSYLHSKNILHRDIKSANILVEENGTCKLSDFGISKKNDYSKAYDASSRMSMQGSIFWIAPEVIKGSKYSAKVDIWSLGCVLIEMWSGSRPWLGFDTVQTMFKLGAGVCPPLPDDLTPDGLDFCKKCLVTNPLHRSTASDLLNLNFSQVPSDFVYSDYYGVAN